MSATKLSSRVTDIDTQLSKLRELREHPAAQSATTEPVPVVKSSWWSVHDAMTISSVVLLFGFAVIVFASRALSQGLKTDQVLRLFGMLTIIIMAVFLIVAGYGNEQIAPAIGLLGTVAGYLLGRSSAVDDSQSQAAAAATHSAKQPTPPKLDA